jgi:hypothetical protein
MKRSVGFLISIAIVALTFSCTKDSGLFDTDIEFSTDNEHIKSTSMNGAVNHKYLYDKAGKIVEENCLFYFRKYLYDENGRLIKIASAWDRSMFSCSMPVEMRTEFMTSKNSVADSYSIYEYDNEDRLSKIENYFNETGNGFEYRSMQTFEYEGSLIVKVNLHDEKGNLTQYHEFTYDNNGNVSKEKYYSNVISFNELMYEISYKYDEYKNPYHIFYMLGSPGLYSNVNNIIETSLIRHSEDLGFDKYSTSTTTYKYNEKDYPVKATYENGVEEYQY